jgi:hypothetical protein
MSLAELLTQPLVLAGGAFLLLGAAGVAYIIKGGGGGKGKKKIIVLQTRDKRAYELPISRERELTLETSKDGVPRRYYKAGPGYTMPNGSTLFFGLEGTAYTALPRDDREQKMDLPTSLRAIWGDEAYNKMPAALKTPLEKHGYGVTIYPEKIADEDKYPKLNVENISDEKKEKLVGYVVKAVRDDGKMDWKTALMGVAIGLILGVLLVSWKVIRLA